MELDEEPWYNFVVTHMKQFQLGKVLSQRSSTVLGKLAENLPKQLQENALIQALSIIILAVFSCKEGGVNALLNFK